MLRIKCRPKVNRFQNTTANFLNRSVSSELSARYSPKNHYRFDKSLKCFFYPTMKKNRKTRKPPSEKSVICTRDAHGNTSLWDEPSRFGKLSRVCSVVGGFDTDKWKNMITIHPSMSPSDLNCIDARINYE